MAPLYLQLYIGDAEAEALDDVSLVAAAEKAWAAAPFDRLMVWNEAGGPARWETLSRLADRLGFELWLWHPIFADTGVEPTSAEEVLGADGAPAHGTEGAWEGLSAGGDEGFRFACPNAAPNRNLVELDAKLPSLPGNLKGVFADRVRYPAPSNGVGALLSCSCPSCRERWAATGHPDDLRRVLSDAAARLASLEDGDARPYPDAPSLLDGIGFARVRAFRAASVLKTVDAYRSLLSRRGLGFGLDLFTPGLAPLVGQDYAALSSRCDWIKSMSYCYAYGPAGIPLELECLDRGLAAAAPRLSPGERRRLCLGTVGLRPANPAESGPYDLPASLAASEAARGQALAGSTPVVVGLELVNHPGFGTRISADQARGYAAALDAAFPAGRPGVAASWNLPYIPPENLAPFSSAGALRSGGTGSTGGRA